MNSVVETLIWASAAVIIAGMLGLLLRGPIMAHQTNAEARRPGIEAANRREQAAARKAEDSNELDSRTIEERAELRRADLRRQTAEADVEAEAIKASAAARIAAEDQLVAARTERKVQAIREGPLNQADAETMPALVDGYKAFCAKTGTMLSFDLWLGDVKWTALDSGTVKALITGYKAFCNKTGTMMDFNSWMGDLSVRDGVLVKET